MSTCTCSLPSRHENLGGGGTKEQAKEAVLILYKYVRHVSIFTTGFTEMGQLWVSKNLIQYKLHSSRIRFFLLTSEVICSHNKDYEKLDKQVNLDKVTFFYSEFLRGSTINPSSSITSDNASIPILCYNGDFGVLWLWS